MKTSNATFIIFLVLFFTINTKCSVAADANQLKEDARCKSAKFYMLENPSSSVVSLHWEVEANFPEPSKNMSENGEFSISCQDFSAEQKNGVFKIIGKKSIFDAWNRIAQLFIIYKDGFTYKNIMEGYYQHTISAELIGEGLIFETSLYWHMFEDLTIGAKFNNDNLVPIVFDGKNMNGEKFSIFESTKKLPVVQIHPNDEVTFYVKNRDNVYQPLIQAFSINMKKNEVILYSTKSFPSK